jgi:hypothetical protein
MTRLFSGAAAVAVTCLVTVSALSAQAPGAAGDRRIVTQDVFKSVTVLRDIPVDTFFDAMGMFANAMGNDCTFCHVPQAALDRAKFAEVTPRMQRARQMIAMMQTINKNFFGGAPRVTCFTCHHGNQSPRSDPNIALQYSTPEEDPNAPRFHNRRDAVGGQDFREVPAGRRRQQPGEADEFCRQGHLCGLRYPVREGSG